MLRAREADLCPERKPGQDGTARFTLLKSRNWHTIVKQWYSNKDVNKKIKIKLCVLFFCEDKKQNQKQNMTVKEMREEWLELIMLIYFNSDFYKKIFAAFFFILNQKWVWVWIYIFEEIQSSSCSPTTLSINTNCNFVAL